MKQNARYIKNQKSDILKRNLFILLISVFLFSCSQFSKSPTSKAWHDMNAKYNAILMCRDYMKLAAFKLDSTRAEDYSRILPVYEKIDSNRTAISKAEYDEVIKLSSLVAERHSNSQFLDEAYLLLGKARYFKEDLINSIEVFKYVNTNAHSEKAKTEALIWLMRAYMEHNDLKLAGEVGDLLATMPMGKKNKIEYFKTRAAYHQFNKELPLAVVLLEEAVKDMKKSREKGRIYFIIGQMYDDLGQAQNARKNWIKVAKNKPDYELEFNAGIALLMSGSLAGTDANFAKMLEDRKNSDLKDKIYFKKGEADLKKQEYRAAINSFSKSAALANDKTQKANAYLKIAEIYHTNLHNYELASNYYDSTLFNLNIKSPGFEEITQKALSLSDFVKYKKALDLEDSLQALAAMNPLALDDLLDKVVKEKEAEKKRLTEMAKEIAGRPENPTNPSPVGKNVWFMYDQVALTQSRTAFIRQWGNRPLEDDWRRKDRQAASVSFKIERGIVGVDDVLEEAPSEEEKQVAAQIEIDKKKKEMKGGIPDTPAKLAQSKRKQQEALYQLGKIYKFQFNQPEEAQKVFQRLLTEHPNSSYEPEVLYFMSLMSENTENVFADELIKKFPQSSFARQMRKGNVTITATTETNAEKNYRELFELYRQGKYDDAIKLANEGLIKYTGTSIEDKFAMIRIRILAAKADRNEYRTALEDFVRSYPSSEMHKEAANMLTLVNK